MSETLEGWLLKEIKGDVPGLDKGGLLPLSGGDRAARWLRWGAVLFCVIALFADVKNHPLYGREATRVSKSEIRPMGVAENIPVFDAAIDINRPHPCLDIGDLAIIERSTKPQGFIPSASGSEVVRKDILEGWNDKTALISGLDNRNLPPTDYVGGRGLSGIFPLEDNSRFVDFVWSSWIERRAVPHASAVGKYISAQLDLHRFDLNIASPNQTSRYECQKDSGNGRYNGIVFVNERSGASEGDDSLEIEGKIFYLLLASAFCLLLGLALLKRWR